MSHKSVVLGMAGAILVASGGLSFVAAGPASAAAPTFSTPCFTSANLQPTGTYTVPASGVTAVRTVLRGQKGETKGLSTGGLGSTLVAEVAVSPGQVLTVGTLRGAPGGQGAGSRVFDGTTFTGEAGGNGGAAQYLSTAGSDGCQHALAVAGGGGGGGNDLATNRPHAVGGNADAGTGATAGGNGGFNYAVDGGGGGGATATGGGSGGAAGHDPGYCSDGNAGSWGGFLSNGKGGDAAGVREANPCYYPGDGGGGAGPATTTAAGAAAPTRTTTPAAAEADPALSTRVCATTRAWDRARR
ncbi:hypothetical protein [Nocardioides mesophilus]|uniref:Glycine rich protein n=1 Tax=Nocardioides mesophilus TaxID=433659 RepID=A0A7G9RDB4_9ACTN|nr:hypothetical protein [Nocardioides mesophilus]QNN53589.1 hypothetical protein H9L09_03955 [Nocardioides mesophilus]